MTHITDLQNYNKEIETILLNHDSFSQNRIFNLYTSIPFEKQKEAFVLALTGKILMLKARLDSKKGETNEKGNGQQHHK